jgi:hypothetical protein
MLSVILLSVVLPSVIMLSLVAPLNPISINKKASVHKINWFLFKIIKIIKLILNIRIVQVHDESFVSSFHVENVTKNLGSFSDESSKRQLSSFM